MGDNSSDSSDDDDIVVYTPNEILKKGLVVARYKRKSVNKVKKATNLTRFESRYGANPAVLAHVWEDLQRAPDPADRVPANKLNLDYFFMAWHFLKRYPEEFEREAQCGWHRDTCRDWGWYYVEKIRALKKLKVSIPLSESSAIWTLTVDGQHCWMHEIAHPEWSINTEWFSHKYNKAGVGYELGISLTEGLVWLNGPFKAGRGDREIFREEGLLAELRKTKKKAIADGGYYAEDLFDVVSTPNNVDEPIVRKFKRRALRRHERFNGMMKEFDCLDERFRHNPARFADCFEAVAVICQYRLEHGSPLFNILIEGM